MEAVGSIPRRLPGPLSYLEKGTLSATGEYNTSKRKKLNTWAGWQQFVDQTIYTILAQRNGITLTAAFYTQSEVKIVCLPISYMPRAVHRQGLP